MTSFPDTADDRSSSEDRPSLTAHVSQNVETIAALHAQAEESVSHHQRFVERLTMVIGRPASLYSILLVAAGWIIFNLEAIHFGLARPLDPAPFFWLQGVTSLAALSMTTIVLTSQNRQAKQAERRAELDLQVNLLAEQKAAKIIALLEELRRDIPIVPNREDPVAAAMARSVDPRAVITALENTFETPPDHPARGPR